VVDVLHLDGVPDIVWTGGGGDRPCEYQFGDKQTW